MTIKRWTPPLIGPPVGQYSHLAVASADRDLLFIAGQVGARPDGSSPADLVKIFTMVAGGEHVAGTRAGRAEHFGRWFPAGDWPTQSLVVVSALAAPEIVVEVEAIAAIPRR